jgi:apolipoprotein D and lipocalin family protein
MGFLLMSRAIVLAVLLATSLPALANQPVSSLDLQRYAGKWHEIARLPMYFQRNCVDNVTATYTALEDGSIEVRNACRKADGSTMESVGEAIKVAGHPGQLKVRFAPKWVSWLPFVWADYWVIDLDPEYRWAVVGGPSTEYLWVLSRTPTMEKALFEQIKEGAKRRGYPVENLIMSAPLHP